MMNMSQDPFPECAVHSEQISNIEQRVSEIRSDTREIRQDMKVVHAVASRVGAIEERVKVVEADVKELKQDVKGLENARVNWRYVAIGAMVAATLLGLNDAQTIAKALLSALGG